MYGTCGRIDNKADFDFDFDFWYTKLVYLKSAKVEQLILYLMHFHCQK